MQAAVPDGGFPRQAKEPKSAGGSGGSGASIQSLNSALGYKELRKAFVQAKKQAPVHEEIEPALDTSEILDNTQGDKNFTSPQENFDSDDSRHVKKVTKKRVRPVSTYLVK